MQSEVEAYISKVMAFVNDDPLTMQAETPKLLAAILEGVSADRLARKPSAKDWSPAEIVAHLADSELVIGYRVRKILSEPGSAIEAYDQNAWARELQWAKRDVPDSVRLFTALREANVSLYRTLTPQQWSSFGVHSERGTESVEHIVRLVAGHDRNHLAQLQRALAA